MSRVAAIGVLLIITLAGCAAGMSSVAISGQGTKDGVETRSLDCGTDGVIAVGFQGQGTIAVSVTDAGGDTLYSHTFQGGQQGESKTLSGEAGDWTLRVTFSGLYGGYQGQYGISLSC